MTDNTKILGFIAKCADAKKLKTLIKNARGKGENHVADVAFRKLISLVPSESAGTVEHDFWQTIYAFEQILSEEREKTTLLSFEPHILAAARQRLVEAGVDVAALPQPSGPA